MKDLKDHPEEDKIRKAIRLLKKRVAKKIKKNKDVSQYNQVKKKIIEKFEVDFS